MCIATTTAPITIHCVNTAVWTVNRDLLLCVYMTKRETTTYLLQLAWNHSLLHNIIIVNQREYCCVFIVPRKGTSIEVNTGPLFWPLAITINSTYSPSQSCEILFKITIASLSLLNDIHTYIKGNRIKLAIMEVRLSSVATTAAVLHQQCSQHPAPKDFGKRRRAVSHVACRWSISH